MSNVRVSGIGDTGDTGHVICDEGIEVMTSRTETQADSVDTESVGEGEDHLLIMSYRANIAANTKRLRGLHGLRQKDLAKLMATGQGHVASLEMGRISIGLHTLTRLAGALKVEASTLLLPVNENTETAPITLGNGSPGATSTTAAVHPVDVAQPPHGKSTAAPELAIGQFAVGVSLTTVKDIVGATHKRLEALERRHGSVPMTREMLTSVLVTLLNASQNVDEDEAASS